MAPPSFRLPPRCAITNSYRRAQPKAGRSRRTIEFQSPHVIESRSKGPWRYFSNVAKWRMTQERTLRYMYRLLEHIRCPKIQFPCNHFFKFTKQNETAGNYRKKTTWLIFQLSSEIHSEETYSKERSPLAFSICSINFHFKIKISTASLHSEN